MYLSEDTFNKAIIDYFIRYPSIYFSFNGSKFDHLILNRILKFSSVEPRCPSDGDTIIRKARWKGNYFLNIPVKP
jgi:hypothetical protein